MMDQGTIIPPISTVLKIDQGLDTVKDALHELLEDEVTLERKGHVSGNSFILGWVKSFTIIMISVTLHKASDNSTNIHIEALNTEPDRKGRRIVQDGFYDFLSFFRCNLQPGVAATDVTDKNDWGGSWRWWLLPSFIIFMTWYFFQK